MKTLVIVRHAKSSWDDPSCSDFERTLNKRGERDAPYMAQITREKGIKADLIISSPANRALTTAKYFAKEQGIVDSNISQKELIYNSGFSEILRLLKKTDNSYNTVMLFGHNPDITHLTSYLLVIPSTIFQHAGLLASISKRSINGLTSTIKTALCVSTFIHVNISANKFFSILTLLYCIL